jgi:hypothetical protein
MCDFPFKKNKEKVLVSRISPNPCKFGKKIALVEKTAWIRQFFRIWANKKLNFVRLFQFGEHIERYITWKI